jgi:hypothetical protein
MKLNEFGLGTLVIVGIVVAIVASVSVVAVVAVVLPGGGGGDNTHGGTDGNGGTTGTGIAGATSLSYDMSSTIGGTSTYTLSAKNIGTNSLMIRIEGTIASQAVTMIINGAQQTAWIESNGYWVDMSSQFSTVWSSWGSYLQSGQTSLSEWTSGTYTSPDGTVTISNVQVNPTLADSLFEH